MRITLRSWPYCSREVSHFGAGVACAAGRIVRKSPPPHTPHGSAAQTSSLPNNPASYSGKTRILLSFCIWKQQTTYFYQKYSKKITNWTQNVIINRKRGLKNNLKSIVKFVHFSLLSPKHTEPKTFLSIKYFKPQLVVVVRQSSIVEWTLKLNSFFNSFKLFIFLQFRWNQPSCFRVAEIALVTNVMCGVQK